MEIRQYQIFDEEELICLWDECGLIVPWNDPKKDIARKLKENSEEIFVGTIDDSIVAAVIAGYDGHRGWVYYLAVHPKHQKQGLGAGIMKYVENYLIKLGCPKINIMVRKTNFNVIDFYRGIGYNEDNVFTLSKRLIHDD